MVDQPSHSQADRSADPASIEALAAYPAQEPLSPLGTAYSARVLALGAGIRGEDIRYGEHPHQALTVFRPQNPTGIVLVVFHGGGWTNGYKEWMSFMAPAFNAQGITLVSATYRLAPEHVFPAGFDDCADAMACTYRLLAAEYGESFCLFVGGHSAGGHYAALLAVTDEWRSRRDLPEDLLAGCLPISGTYWFGESSGLSMRPRFLGADPAAEDAASPLRRLASPFTPPFFLSYGSRDFPHLIRQSEVMIDALRERGIACDVSILQDCDHFEAAISAGSADHPWVAEASAWMARRCSAS
jgi:arylformamidase